MDGGPLLFKTGVSAETSSDVANRILNCERARGWRAAPFQTGALTLAPKAFVLKRLQQLQGWRAGRFQHGALALAPRPFDVKVFNREGGSLPKWGSRPGAAHILLNSLQQLHGWRAGRFQNGALALAPRTFV